MKNKPIHIDRLEKIFLKFSDLYCNLFISMVACI